MKGGDLNLNFNLNTVGLNLPSHIHTNNSKSFGELKNESMAKMVSKRQGSLGKDGYPKIKERKPRQRLSIDVYNQKVSPDHQKEREKGYQNQNSTKAISRRRSTLISKMKSQVSEEFINK